MFDGLDWMSSFALFLRFLPPSSPLDQAVDEYQDAFNNGRFDNPMIKLMIINSCMLPGVPLIKACKILPIRVYLHPELFSSHQYLRHGNETMA